jgi:RNA polymerase sigma-70 factor (ECF subfamily)
MHGLLDLVTQNADALVAAAVGGDEDAFGALAKRYERELHVHCYRMLGSFDEAEDVTQEALLKAWRNLASFDGRNFRAWLYRIATNAAVDVIRRRRPVTVQSYADIPWLQPYPDRMLDLAAPREDEPDAVVVARETIELAFLATIQLLPARQRAVLLLRDVLAWSAQETALTLEMTEAAVNSALQRARATLAGRKPPSDPPSAYERDLLRKMIDAHSRSDVDASIALMREDIRITMPPLPMCFDGLGVVEPLLRHAFGEGEIGHWRLVPVAANRMPAFASYLRKWGDTEFRAFKFDLIRLVDGRIAEITTFNEKLFPAFGLPPVLHD